MGLMIVTRHQKGGGVSPRWVSLFCISSFCFGVFVVNRLWGVPDSVNVNGQSSGEKSQEIDVDRLNDCNKKETPFQDGDILTQVSQTHDVIMTLDKTISNLEMQLAAARAAQAGNRHGPITAGPGTEQIVRQKVFFVMGIITAFSSRKRRDSIRATWMPQGENLRKLEKDKGIIMRFVIGHSATTGGVLDRAIDAEDEEHQDFLRLDHIEGYHELSSKTQIYFSTAVEKWDADFYIKVDDDVHVNPGIVASLLARHKSKPRVYLGCMKSGPVLAQKGVKYHEPEYWKFGEEGNKYFRHATGQLYAISKDLATYISVNRHILHRYANEDVSLGSWFIGLDLEHIDERSFCCGSPPGDGRGSINTFQYSPRVEPIPQHLKMAEQILRFFVIPVPSPDQQIANGRPRQGTPALHLLIGAAVAFANQLREWTRYISVAGKARVPFGM